MNEQERSRQFNRAVDHLLATGEIPHASADDEGSLLALSKRLMETDLSHLNTESQRTREKLIQHFYQPSPNHTTTRGQERQSMNGHQPLRRAMAVMVASTIMMAAVLSIPPLRSAAQAVLQQLGLLQFTHESTIPEQLAGSQAAVEVTTTGGVPGILSLQQAHQQSGLAVYEPGFTPSGYVLTSRQVFTTERGIQIRTDYGWSSQTDMAEPDFLSMTQWQLSDPVEEPLRWAIGTAQPTEVTVNGETGLYVQGAPTGRTVDENGINQIVGVNILVWEQDGYLFILQSFQLTLEDMQLVAASLRQ